MITPNFLSQDDRDASADGEADRAYRRAWWSLALYPVSVVLAFAIGEGLFTVLTAGETDPATWKVMLAAVPALFTMVVPGLLAVHQSRRAVRHGRRDGWVPAIVGAAIGLGFIGINAVSYLLTLVVD